MPGAFVYGHISRVAIEAWGAAWAERGAMCARFRRPVYNGDGLTISCGAALRGGADRCVAPKSASSMTTARRSRLAGSVCPMQPKPSAEAGELRAARPGPRFAPAIAAGELRRRHAGDDANRC